MSIQGFCIRALDASGDWLWGQSLNDLLVAQSAIAENVQTSLLCFQNTYPWDMTFGVDWLNLLGSTDPEAETGILLQAREVIINSYGITAINAIDVVENAETRAIQLLYNLSSIYSTDFSADVQPLSA